MIPATPKPEPPRSVTDPFDFLTRLEDLRADTDYEWASDTIEGIYTTVTESGRVTDGQLRAIDNIEDAVEQRPQWR
jgi:hypothetical protein